MDFLKLVLFESPIWLGGLCFCLFGIVLLMRPRMSDAARARSLPVVLAIIVALFLQQWLIVTDREKILAQLDAFVAAITAEDRPAIERLIDDDYSADGMNREDVIAFLAESLERVDIFDTRLRRRDVTVTGDTAGLDLGAMATVRIKGGVGEFHHCRWRIDWRLRDAWRITALTPVEIDTIPFKTLQQVRGQIP